MTAGEVTQSAVTQRAVPVMREAIRAAAKEALGYAALSFASFAVNLALYVGAFSVAQPKYTFLFGNSLLAILLAAECVLLFYTACVRRKTPDVSLFRRWLSGASTGLLLLYGLHATVFTIVERSVSMNVLRFLASGQAEPYQRIAENFEDTFVRQDSAICKRLDEQVHLGNVAAQNGQYVLTRKGAWTFTLLDSARRLTAEGNPKNAVHCAGD
jgi:hypothetical protein